VRVENSVRAGGKLGSCGWKTRFVRVNPKIEQKSISSRLCPSLDRIHPTHMDSSGDAEQHADNGASLIERMDVIADIAATAKQNIANLSQRDFHPSEKKRKKDVSDSIHGLSKNAISALCREAKKADNIIGKACKLAKTSIRNSAKIAIRDMNAIPAINAQAAAPQQNEVGPERAPAEAAPEVAVPEVAVPRDEVKEVDLVVVRRDGTAPFYSATYTNSMSGLTEGGLHEFPPVPNLRAFLHDWATHNDECHIMIHQGNGTSSPAKQFIDEVRRADVFSASFPQKGSTAYKKHVLAEFTAVVNLILDLFDEEDMPPSLRRQIYATPLTNPIARLEFLFDYLE
jgi:hypothetical protein